MHLLSISLLFSLSYLTCAQLYPIAGSTFNVAAAAVISTDVAAYYASQTTAPAYTSARGALATVTATALQEVLYDFDADPFQLAQALFSANSTPTWYPLLPSAVQAYVSSLAAAQASIESKDATITAASATTPSPTASSTAKSGAGHLKTGAANLALVGIIISVMF